MAKAYGKWAVRRSLSEGGQAVVFVVEDATGARSGEYVLKRLKNLERAELFRREVEVTQNLRRTNRHILEVIESDTEGAEPYYVAEYCAGGSLAKAGAATYKGNIRDAVAVLLPLIDAVRECHKGAIVHRDVKPPNILFRGDGAPVLGDFGICHVVAGERVTLTDEAMGSLNYIAPEMQAGGGGNATGAVDIYALGKVLYWMLSGGRIFARENHRATDIHLPTLLGDQRWEHVHALLDRAVVEDAAKRMNASDMLLALKDTERLVLGAYTPLRPSMGLVCRFCGIGKYVKYATNQGWPQGRAGWFGQLARVSGSDVRILRCDNCGHVEWIDYQGIKDGQWWDK